MIILCFFFNLILAKIIRERWKFWSGTVPANVSVSLINNFFALELFILSEKKDSFTSIRITFINEGRNSSKKINNRNYSK